MIAKSAYEEFFRYHEFKRPDGKGWLGDEETASTAAVTIFEKDSGQDLSASMISAVSPYGNTKVKYMIKAGTAGKIYTIKIKITTSMGQKFEDTLDFKVI